MDAQTGFHGLSAAMAYALVLLFFFGAHARCYKFAAVPGPTAKAVAADPGLLRFGPPEPFSFDGLIERARRLAAQLYVPPPAAVPEVVQQIDYDAHRKLAFKLRSEWRPPADRRCV